jgi:hypothetical protein
VTEEHIEPVRTREGGVALATIIATGVGIGVLVPIVTAVVLVDTAVWGLQVLGRQVRRGTGRVIVWLIGSRGAPRV